MTILYISYRDTSYGRTSNCMTKWFLSKEDDSEEAVWIGYCTIPARGLFKLFVVGKPIQGIPSELRVKLSRRETKVFRMITRAGFDRKRNVWQDLLDGKITQKEMLDKLVEKLPIWILSRKLSPEKILKW